MSYIDDVIEAVTEQLPDQDPELLRLYALLVLVRRISPRDVHDAWAIWRHSTQRDHLAMIPFDQLAPGVQRLDDPYAAALERADAKIRGRTND